MTYLGMQVLIEGLALAAFQRIRDSAKNNLAAAVNAYVMQDEARHVTFGRMALREYYPHLSDAERAEREEFTVEALYFMRDRFNQAEVWMRSGLPVDKLMEYAYNSGAMQSFRTRLFTRIVPILKEIGLFGPKVQKALGDMGVMEYAKIDVEQADRQRPQGRRRLRRQEVRARTRSRRSSASLFIRPAPIASQWGQGRCRTRQCCHPERSEGSHAACTRR